MLVSMAEIMNKARAEGYGVTAPNVQSEDTVRAVIEVAEELNAPMIIDVNHFVHKDFVYFGHMICDLVERSRIPFAAWLVKVTAVISSGRTPFSSIK